MIPAAIIAKVHLKDIIQRGGGECSHIETLKFEMFHQTIT